MKINHIKSNLVICLYFLLPFLFSVILSCYLGFNDTKINNTNFIIDYLGLFLGFTIALLSFAISIIDKVKKDLLSNSDKDAEKIENQIAKLSSVFTELKEDTMVIFWFFIVVVAIYIFENINIPFIKWPFKGCFSKILFLNHIKFSIFILSLYAIYDILKTIFLLSESTGVNKKTV